MDGRLHADQRCGPPLTRVSKQSDSRPSGRRCGRTNAIESVNARIRRTVRARKHFRNEQAPLKCVYLAVMARPDRDRPPTRDHPWKVGLNAFDITFRRPPVPDSRPQTKPYNIQLHRSASCDLVHCSAGL
jgi:hypothetical protein